MSENTAQHNTKEHNRRQYSTMEYTRTLYNTMGCSSTQLNAMQNNNEKVERCYDSYNSKAISRSQMATWIIEAIKQGNRDLGVSKSYLKKYLSEVNGMPNNAYYIRKLNTVLTMGIDEKRLMFDKVHSLYKLV